MAGVGERLGREFFARPAPVVAEALLGQWLCRRIALPGNLTPDAETRSAETASTKACGNILADAGHIGIGSPEYLVSRYRITEAEAYFGLDDTASHAFRGRTARNELMWGKAGLVYVYLCYGIHNLQNIITGPEGHPEGVLIRGIEGFSGPGRLTKHLQVTRQEKGADIVTSNDLWIESGDPPLKAQVEATGRIGIGYAAPEDQTRPWRFIFKPHTK